MLGIHLAPTHYKDSTGLFDHDTNTLLAHAIKIIPELVAPHLDSRRRSQLLAAAPSAAAAGVGGCCWWWWRRRGRRGARCPGWAARRGTSATACTPGGRTAGPGTCAPTPPTSCSTSPRCPAPSELPSTLSGTPARSRNKRVSPGISQPMRLCHSSCLE